MKLSERETDTRPFPRIYEIDDKWEYVEYLPREEAIEKMVMAGMYRSKYLTVVLVDET